MAKQKQQSHGALKASAVGTHMVVKPGGPKRRGKRQPRRWAQKLEGSIINHNRRINHDDQGNPFPG